METMSSQSTINIDISRLPLDVIIHIMSYLSISDRMAAGLVNQTWHDASLATEFIDQELMIFGPPRIDHLYDVLNILENSSRPVYNFIFKEVELKSTMSLWRQYGSFIKILHLFCCDLSERTLIGILKHCNNLRTLHISSCRECFMSGRLLDDDSEIKELLEKLKFLQELSLTYNRYLTDALFNQFISICPNVNMLNLKGCEISFHYGLFKKFYPNNNAITYASESVLTFFNILQYITSSAKQLKHLDFSHTLIDGTALATLSKLENLRLETLKLQRCNQLTIVGIRTLTFHQINLKLLDISFCTRITDFSLVLICKHLKQLESLNIRRCRAITDSGIQQIQLLRNLRELDISECEQLTSKCITDGLCNETLNNLQFIDNEMDIEAENIDLNKQEADCSITNNDIRNDRMWKLSVNALNLDESCITSIVKCFPNLRYLDVGYCFIAITDITIQNIFEKLIFLRTLKVTHCDRITDAGLMGIDTSNNIDIQSLKVNVIEKPSESLLRISLRSRAEEEIVCDANRTSYIKNLLKDISTLSPLTMPAFSLTRLKGLRELDFSGCTRITDVSLKHHFAFIELRVLSLRKCCQITHVGLEYVAKNNPAIEELDLTLCYNISDLGVSYLAMYLHRLKRLYLQGCTQLTNESLKYIRDNCKSLQYLDIRHCKKITIFEIPSLPFLHIESTQPTENSLLLDNVHVPIPPPMYK
ncbi:dynein regulatory complex subunit 6 [Polistes fuscatus]|uniref:dynein regulatory complex subunit 6 n=1 Tax=Polistes fuscatus TaxID=30207 RepID=UPI001CA9840F|nr:dynein regulatory complex subunit 6 [Polistes fuscatus]